MTSSMNPGGIALVRRDVPEVEITDDVTVVRRKSTDRSAMLGPLMAEEVQGAMADAVAMPTTQDQIVAVAAACARHRVPVVPRGGGTSTFGQSIPLEGGLVVDLSRLAGVIHADEDRVRVLAGTTMDDVDQAVRPFGRELRIHPSSRRMSTTAGFVIGGHGGIGSMRHGGLADVGNVLGLRVVTIEAEPRTIELRGTDVGLEQFSFGMSGIVTEVELPLGPLRAWRDLVVSFPLLSDAMRFGGDLTVADGLDVKNCAPFDWGMARHMTPLLPYLPPERAGALVMVAPAAIDGVQDLAARHGGHVTLDVAVGEGPNGFPGYEYTWGHALWWLRKQQPNLGEILFLLPQVDPVDTLDHLLAGFDGERWVSSTCQRIGGHPSPQVALGVDGSIPGQIARVSALAESLDCLVVNIHQAKLGSSSIRDFGAEQRAFKADVDPHGLCNPGHLAEPGGETAAMLIASGWSSRWGSAVGEARQ